MSRKLATISQILSLHPIEKADNLEVATVRGWHVVVQKGQFRPLDYCVYIECDSLLPLSNPHFEFLRQRAGETATHFRVRTIKLRGQISQGIVFPTSILPDGTHINPEEDVSELLGITKYEPPIPFQLSGEIAGAFPSFFPKTDEERLQNLLVEIMVYSIHNYPLYVTEKLDGTSVSLFKLNGEFGVCSRNWRLHETEGNLYWRMAGPLRDVIPEGFAVQGEIIGPGVQKNPLNRPTHELYVFRVIHLEGGRVLSFDETTTFCRDLGLNMVPVYKETFRFPNIPNLVDELLSSLPAKSALNPKALCEGHVFRTKDHSPYFSCKLIRPEYLLKQGD